MESGFGFALLVPSPVLPRLEARSEISISRQINTQPIETSAHDSPQRAGLFNSCLGREYLTN